MGSVMTPWFKDRLCGLVEADLEREIGEAWAELKRHPAHAAVEPYVSYKISDEFEIYDSEGNLAFSHETNPEWCLVRFDFAGCP